MGNAATLMVAAALLGGSTVTAAGARADGGERSARQAGMLGAKPRTTAPRHPLDPLSKAEIQRAFTLVEADERFVAGSFPLVELRPPPKADVLAWVVGEPFRRDAFVQVYDQVANLLTEVVVDLDLGAIGSWTPRPGEQPPVYMTEWTRADEIVRADLAWQAAMAARGLALDDLYLDVWAPGDTSDVSNPDGHRLFRALTFFSGGEPHQYPRPVEGLVVVIDMTDERVLSVTDTGPVPVATDEPGHADHERAPLPPLAGRPRRSGVPSRCVVGSSAGRDGGCTWGGRPDWCCARSATSRTACCDPWPTRSR